jgi:hypothetical protein
MLRLTIAVVAIVFAGSAGAAGWKSLKVDGSSETAFAESLSVFKDKLSPTRRYVFGEALKDIWVQGVKQAEADEREYGAAEYYRQLHGLTYDEIVKLTDPSGATALARYRQGVSSSRSSARVVRGANTRGLVQQSRPTLGWGHTPQSVAQQIQQCGCWQPNGPQGD